MKALDPLAVPLDGTVLVEASAGTGKTWTLAALYLRLLLEKQLPVGQILVVTYTNAATAELRERVRRRLREAVAAFEQAEREGPNAAEPSAPRAGTDLLATLVARARRDGSLDQSRRLLAAALRDFDEAAIFTIHGFCQRILLENAFESGVPFDAELVTDERPLCSEVVQDFWVRTLHAAPAALVPHLQTACSPQVLEKLARKVLASRDMPVLPGDVPPLDAAAVERVVAEWCAAHAAAAAAWPACAAEVQALLSSPVMKGAYTADKVTSWCDAVGDFLAQRPTDAPIRFAPLERFTAASLRAGTRVRETTPSHPFFALCERMHAAEQAIDAAGKDWTLALQAKLVHEVRAEVARRHEAANTQSFDDLLYRLRDALAGSGGTALAAQIRARFRTALIDEFQDTDPVQYAIFRTVYQGSDAPLFLIGDPKQAIYAFRGADVFTYIDAKQSAGDDAAYTLATNHRSAAALVRGVNTLFKRVRDPFVFDAIPFTEVGAAQADQTLTGDAVSGPPLEILWLDDATADGSLTKERPRRHVPSLIAADVVRLLAARPMLGERPLHAGDVAVLCRTNQQAVDVQEALRKVGVASVRQGDDSVFASPEAEEIERVLRAVAEPSDPHLLRAALATRLVGPDAAEIARLHDAENDWDDWAARFRRWLDLWIDHGFMAAFQRLLEDCATQARLLALDDGERRLTNVLHVAELLQSASREAHRGPLALVDWLALMRDDPAASADLASEAAQVRLESDDRAVQLVTIHRSKGLEYGVVYCPYTWEGMDLHPDDKRWVRFHDPADGALRLDLGSRDLEANVERASVETFAESLRLLYVAVTRARHRCTLVWSRVNGDHRTPLGYLLHGPAAGAPGPAGVQATQSFIEALDREARLADLRALAAESGGTIALRHATLPAPSGPPLPGEEQVAPLRAPLAQQRRLDLHWRVSSFSGLAASGGRTSHQAEEGLDHDATATEAASLDGSATVVPERIVLHDLPKGARTGELLHAILERVDFQRADRAELDARVHDAVGEYGFESRWEAPLAYALDEMLATPIVADGRTFRLADVAPARRFNELQFLFGVRAGFSVESLARCFERHPCTERTADYPERVRRLRFEALEGYLGGFIDLVFEHDGRWYVVDYKSNFLGATAASYAPARLRVAMSQHHYHLQYHLYALAVLRYLTLRVPGFEPARHFGGVAYLFLRGMARRHPDGCGVFFTRPSEAILADLSALVGPAGSEAAR